MWTLDCGGVGGEWGLYASTLAEKERRKIRAKTKVMSHIGDVPVLPVPPCASPSLPVYVRLSSVPAMGPHPSGEGRGAYESISVVGNEGEGGW